ncbi:MAG: rhomboid family intramembrane serine protease [Phycisphaeraceae bacterium]|nr:rhomboid family intramembrane serine protease [Phycisphaeraceae bacterium]
MGLADRDYYRARSGGGGAVRPSDRVWSLKPVSVNTWLIVINILVFVVGGTLLHGKDWSVAGSWAFPEGTTQEQMRLSWVDEKVTFKVPDGPGHMFYHPVYVPRVDSAGKVRMGPDGKPAAYEPVGRQEVLRLPILTAIGHFSTGKAFIQYEVWRFITFQFLHANWMHIAFNMLGLYFVGGMVEQRLGGKRYLAFYLMCGICGALVYLFLNLLGYLNINLPGVLFSDPYTPLVGASAGVFGVLLAAAYLYPREIVDVLFILPMELRTAVYAFTALAVVNLFMGGNNAGGDAAHVGGAIAGAYFIRHPHLLNEFFDIFGRSAPAAARKPGVARAVFDDPEIDRIMAKASQHGLASLSDGERRALRSAREGLG